jgi:hypothetical protein
VRAEPAADVSENDRRAQDDRADSSEPSKDCLRVNPNAACPLSIRIYVPEGSPQQLDSQERYFVPFG